MPIDILQLTSFLIRFAFTLTTVFVFAMFFLKVLRARGSGVDLSPFIGLAIFILCIGIGQTFFIYYDFVFLEDTGQFLHLSLTLYKGNALISYCGTAGVVFFSEKLLRKTKYIITLYSIAICIYAIVFLNTNDDIKVFNLITLPISLVFSFIVLIYAWVVRTKGEIRHKMTMIIIGLLIFFVFYMLHTSLGQQLSPFPNELTIMIAMIGLIVTTLFWSSIILGFETFTEFGWKEKMRELFIIAPNGVTLFHYVFKETTDVHTTDLISAGFTGIKDLLSELIQSKKNLKVVDHQDVKIIFDYGSHATLALIASENFRIYHSKLALLTTKFETLFQDFLSHWTGETEIFLPSKQLIEEIFI